MHCLKTLLRHDEQDEEEQGRAGGAVALDDSDGDDAEGEEAPTHTFDHDSEDDTAHPQQLLSFVGAAQAPSGYKILESCPRVLRQMRTYRTSLV